MAVNLWPWQVNEAEHALDPARAFYWDPRTGKTREARVHIERLHDEKNVSKFLIIAPKQVLMEVWEDELADLRPFNLYEGKVVDRVGIIQDLMTKYENKGRPPMFILLVNWDVLAKKPLLEALMKWGPQVVIADELHYAMTAGSARSRALHRLGRLAKYRRGLTGTPTPKNYIDAYSQYKFLDPTIFGTSKEKFIDRYVELDYWGRPKRYRHLPELRQKMFSIASRVDRKSVWGDRPPLEVVRKLILPPTARNLYDRLVTEAVGDFEGVEIDATHKLAQITKLQQLTAGFVTDGQETLWVHDTKIEAGLSEIKDLLASDQKVVLFFHFTPEGKRYDEAIRKEFGAVVGLISGQTPMSYRKTLQTAFAKEDSDLRVMLMQDSLGIGISLKAASYVIRSSYPLDYAAFVQSNDRVYEPGKPLTYIYLDASKTVDQFARSVVLTKQQASHRLLDVGFEKALRGE